MSGGAAADGALWAITSYFNPMHYKRRRANYQGFRKRLQVPLAAIELSFDGRYELGAGDADLLVQLRGDDIMWQKERLLNVLLPQLPAACRHIAWLDCDIVFERQDWPERVVKALSRAALVQPFRRVLHMPSRVDADDAVSMLATLTAESIASATAAGNSIHEALGRVTDRRSGVPTPGIAWAASRDLVARHGFYDACVIGGGDTALTCAAFGVYEHATRLHYMNDLQQKRYLAWAEPFHRNVCGAVSCLDGDVYHLWHGEIADRGASRRHEGLRLFSFDPDEDIAITDQGCWRWATDKPEMHRYVRDYFAARKEDG